MEYRQLGNSDVMLSAITFGAWAIGEAEVGGVDPDNLVKALQKAHEIGCTSIDTAPCYGLGLSEQMVGKAIRELPRDKVQVLTKCGVVWEGDKGLKWYKDLAYGDRVVNWYKYSGRESIMRECEDSLRRLGTDYIDLYSVHYLDPTTPIEESMEALARLKEQGKIRAAGVCNYRTAEMRTAGGVVDVESNKVRYSMLNRVIEDDLVPYCLEHKKSILAYSVLQRGILTGWDLPKFTWGSEKDNPMEVALYDDENMKRIRTFQEKIKSVAEDNGATLTQLSIRWTIDRPGITTGLLGATNPDQIVYDAKALEVSLSASDMETINGYLAELEMELKLPATGRHQFTWMP